MHCVHHGPERKHTPTPHTHTDTAVQVFNRAVSAAAVSLFFCLRFLHFPVIIFSLFSTPFSAPLFSFFVKSITACDILQRKTEKSTTALFLTHTHTHTFSPLQVPIHSFVYWNTATCTPQLLNIAAVLASSVLDSEFFLLSQEESTEGPVVLSSSPVSVRMRERGALNSVIIFNLLAFTIGDLLASSSSSASPCSRYTSRRSPPSSLPNAQRAFCTHACKQREQ